MRLTRTLIIPGPYPLQPSSGSTPCNPSLRQLDSKGR
jgi:hypothetical protein